MVFDASTLDCGFYFYPMALLSMKRIYFFSPPFSLHFNFFFVVWWLKQLARGKK